VAAHVTPCAVRTNNTPQVRLSATLREEPKKELACVIGALRTESRLHFSALLHDGAPDVRFERVAASYHISAKRRSAFSSRYK
jgi:hypothetical protein